MNIFSWFRKTKPIVIDPPKPGEQWGFKDFKNSSPWPKKGHTVKILDVKDGWVRYAFPSVFTDERHTIETFTRMYSKIS